MTPDSLPKEVKEYINYDEGLTRIMNNKKVYSRTLGMFAKTKEVDNLKEALAAGDLEKAAHIVHTVKGMAGNLSIVKVLETSSVLQPEFEKGIRNEENISAFFEAAEKTMEYLPMLIEALNG